MDQIHSWNKIFEMFIFTWIVIFTGEIDVLMQVIEDQA